MKSGRPLRTLEQDISRKRCVSKDRMVGNADMNVGETVRPMTTKQAERAIQ